MNRRRRSRVFIPAIVTAAVVIPALLRPSPARADAMSSSSSSNPAEITAYGQHWFEYQLTSANGLGVPDPNATAPQVVFQIPTGSNITPPSTALYPYNNSPQAYTLSYTNGSGASQTTVNNSSGFDQSQMVLGLNNDASTGQQLFGLSFYGSGLKSAAQGGVVDFWLSFNPSVTTAPLLKLDPATPAGSTASFAITPVVHTAATTAPTTTTTTTASNPAPTTTATTTTATTKTAAATTPTTTTVTSTTTPTATTPTQVAVPTVITPEPMSVVLWSAVAGLGLLRARGFRRRRAA